MSRFTLLPGRWYGWTMYPGYVDAPYHSPIRVNEITALHRGTSEFKLAFYNMGYAAGVQMMAYTLRTLRRETDYLLAAVADSERSVAIVPLSLAWIGAHAPTIRDEVARSITADGLDIHEAMARVSGAICGGW